MEKYLQKAKENMIAKESILSKYACKSENAILKTNRFKFLYIRGIHLTIWLISLILYTVIRNIFIYST